ncbi:hypothetical protein [Hymenobacter arcticus]
MNNLFQVLLAGLLWVAGSNLAWAQAPAWQTLVVGKGECGIKCLASDAAGNVYMAGSFDDTMQLGSLTLTTSAPGGALFVAKWSPVLARFLWAQQASAQSQVLISHMAVQGGNVYLLGSLWGDTLQLSKTVLVTGGSVIKGSNFIAKLVDEGTSAHFSWVSQPGKLADDQAEISALAVHGSSIFVAGNFRDSTTVFGSKMLHASAGRDLFVAKLTDEKDMPHLQWVQEGGPTPYKYAGALAVQGKFIYVAGNLPKTASSFGNKLVVRAGQRNAYVAKLRDEKDHASWVWAQRIGSAQNNHVDALAVQGACIYVAGNYFRTGKDKPVTSDSTQLAGEGIYVTKVEDSGSASRLVWAAQAGGTRSDFAEALVVRGKNLYVAGRTNSDTMRLGSIKLVNTDTTHYFDNALVAKLTDMGERGIFAWVQQAGGQSQDAATSLAISGKRLYVSGVFCGGRIGRTDALHTSGFLAALTDKSLSPTSKIMYRIKPVSKAAPTLPRSSLTAPSQPVLRFPRP